MIEDKIGKKPYLGIVINYDKEKKLDKFSLDTLKDRYFWEEETHAQEAFARASVFGATYKGETDFDLAQRLYEYSSDLWFMFSTPILSNGGTTRGLPISCFLNYVPDSRRGLSDHYDENIWLASSGGGIGGYWGNVRSNGIGTSNHSRSTGSIPFMHVVDSQMLAFNQGVTRRGSYAAYMDISHPEVEEFINMRKESGGDINRKCLNIHNAINITNEYLDAVKNDEDWRLIDPKSGEAVKIINARDLWWQMLNARAETGEPYMINIDTCNEYLPKEQKDLGLRVNQSNLCSEIVLATNEERTAVCCLSSVNLEKYDEWQNDDNFIPDLVRLLDNVLEHFIQNAPDSLAKAKYSASQERSIGLGAMGFHAYLQKNNIPFESPMAKGFNLRAFNNIKSRAFKATQELAEERGECPDGKGFGVRNAHLLAVAPNASSGIICGNTSPSIEPYRANAFTQKTKTGSSLLKNKFLEEKLEEYGENTDDVWKSIITNNGSVQHLDFLSDWEKNVFKTSVEIDQRWVVDHAADRQEFICQSQSCNLFFPSNVSKQELHNVHMRAWKNGVKTLYYLRSEAIKRADVVSDKVLRSI